MANKDWQQKIHLDIGKLRDAVDDQQEQIDELIERQRLMFIAMGLGQPINETERTINWECLTEVRRIAKEMVDG